MTSDCRVDRLFWMPSVQQGADFNAGQLWTSLQPRFNSGTLLFVDRTTGGFANQTEVITADVVQAVAVHCFSQECFEESVNRFIVQTFFEVQVQFETQLLKFINAQFFAQTPGTVSRHWNNPLK